MRRQLVHDRSRRRCRDSRRCAAGAARHGRRNPEGSRHMRTCPRRLQHRPRPPRLTGRTACHRISECMQTGGATDRAAALPDQLHPVVVHQVVGHHDAAGCVSMRGLEIYFFRAEQADIDDIARLCTQALGQRRQPPGLLSLTSRPSTIWSGQADARARRPCGPRHRSSVRRERAPRCPMPCSHVCCSYHERPYTSSRRTMSSSPK